MSFEEGVSQSIVYAISQDSIGNIWMASEEGVIRYNSKNSETYNKYDGLPDEFGTRIRTIFIDSGNKVWIGGENGIAYFDEGENDFKKIELSGNLQPSLVKFFAEDEDGNLWVGCFNGLWKLTHKGDNTQVKRVQNLPNVQTVHYINNSILAGTDSGLYRIDTQTGEIVKLTGLNKDYSVTDLARLNDTTFIIGTRRNGIILTDNDFNFKRNIDLPTGLRDFPVFDLIVQGDKVYIATDGAGLIVTNRVFEQFEIFQSDEDDLNSISSNGIYDIHIGRENILWIATYGGGVNYYNPTSNNFSVYRHIINEPNSLSNNFVRAIAEDDKERIWFGTKKGISIFDKKTGAWKYLPNLKETGNTTFSEIILALEPDGENMWVGTYDSGAYKVSTKDLATKHFSSQELPSFGLNKIYDIYRDKTGDIWFGGIDGELTQLKENGQVFTFNINQVKHIISGPGNTILIAGRNGVHQLDPESGRITQFTKLTPGNNQFDYFTINAIASYDENQLLVGTNGGGLLIYNTEDQSIRGLNKAKGMPSDIIQGILIGDENEIWASTTSGLVNLDLKANDTLIRVYDESDGLSGTEFNYGSFKKLKGGLMAFGGTRGATVFNPSKIQEANMEPKIFFEDFSLANSSANEEHNPLKKSINVTDKIDLKYNQNSFSFRFVGVLHNGSSKIRYSWKLEGFEEEWTEPSTLNVASYTNMGPGNYTFKVKAANRMGEFGPPREINIEIHSPWYSSPLAILVYVILLAGVFLLVVYVTSAFVNKKNAEQQVDFYNNLTHEIRTPLAILMSSLDNYSRNRSDDQNNTRLKGTIKRLNSLFEQMLTYQKSTTGDSYRDVDAIAPQAHIAELAEDFEPMLEERHLEIEFNNEWNEELFYFNKEDFDKVIFNLISNAIKYSFDNEKITLKTSKKDEFLKITITDKGIGIPKDQQKNILRRFYRARNVVNSQKPGTGLGLMLVKNIAEKTGGEISFVSEENKGTTFTVFLKNMKTAYKKSAILEKSESTPINLAETGQLTEFSDSKILIVEDNDDLRNELVKILGNYFQIYEAKNGRQGLEMASQVYPDLIITDLIMPVMDGQVMTRKIKSDINLNHIPIFMLTVLQNRSQKLESLEHGVSEYLEKPIDINLLIAKIFNSLNWQKKLQKRYQEESELETAVKFRNESDEKFIKEIEAYILEKIRDESFSVHDICEKFNMSRTSLYMKLKNLIDLSPQDLIINTRLKFSKNLLINTRKNIKEVAYESGFSNPKYFSTSFKKFYHLTPSQYRTRIKSKIE
ncbi:hybrid sensor histidine kinase/response regulator transcription factor [Salegentibacter chungangensis]|uniref:histidine kinase n=1 Tax=Salegentibacter chungangensis TaxID=1335724 RepID=A0ABW3NLX1_9FLAO